MIGKGDLAIDKRGLIFEAYQIENITDKECRTVFLDWAMSSPDGSDMQAMLAELMRRYGKANPDHPMTRLIADGMSRAAAPGKRRR